MRNRRQVIILVVSSLIVISAMILFLVVHGENHGMIIKRSEKENFGEYLLFVLQNNSKMDVYYVLDPRVQMNDGDDWSDYVAADEVGMTRGVLMLKLGAGQATEIWARTPINTRDSFWRVGVDIIQIESDGVILKFHRWLRRLFGQSLQKKTTVWSEPQIDIESKRPPPINALNAL